MINPAEDIVNVWLQECENHFTMSNVCVPKKGGGSRKEIDIVSTDGKKFYWIEISVSPNPRLPPKEGRMDRIISNVVRKFGEDKQKYLEERFKGIQFEKWDVYSPNLFSTSKEEAEFCSALEKREIKAVNFEDILSKIGERLTYMGYDVTRKYLYLFKKFKYP